MGNVDIRYRAIKANIGDSCLDLMSGPQLVVKNFESSKPGNYSLIAIPASFKADYDEYIDCHPDWIWDPARTGAGRLMFDASLEGHQHDVKRSNSLHRLLSRLGIPRESAVYVTQDRAYADHYSSVFSGEPLMRTAVYDYWVRAVVGAHSADGRQVFESRLAAYRARGRRRDRRFLSLNRTLRISKIMFLLRLLRDGLWDQGFVSTGGIPPRLGYRGFGPGQLEAELQREPSFAPMVAELRGMLPSLEAIGRIEFLSDAAVSGADYAMDLAIPEYNRSWFSVVTETEMRDRLFRITEKPLKSLLNFHPFLVLGNPGSLALLRTYGFRSFPEIFDESYDEEPDPARRFEMVLGELARLCAMDETELERLHAAAGEAIVHNAWHGLVDLPRQFEDRLDIAFVEYILGLPPRNAAPAA